MRVKIDRDDLMAALDIIEARHPDAAMSIATITNERHAFGTGASIALIAQSGEQVYEKRSTLAATAQMACDRLDRRIAGDKGA